MVEWWRVCFGSCCRRIEPSNCLPMEGFRPKKKFFNRSLSCVTSI